MNRVTEIQVGAANLSCRHMPTKCNPSDLVSCGCSVNELRDSIGSFLLQESAKWPINDHFELTKEQESLEKRKSNVCLAVEKPTNIFLNFIERFSSYKNMLRLMSDVLRFVDGVRKRKISKRIYPAAQWFVTQNFWK